MNTLVALSLTLCMLAAVEAGIYSPLYLTHPGNSIIIPELDYRKIFQYSSKPVFSGYSSAIFEDFPRYVIQPVVQDVSVHSPAIHSTPLFLVPAIKPISPTVQASANAVSGSGVASSSAVSRSYDPVSVVANSVPGAAYSTAVIHPGRSAAPVAAGAHASVYGGSR